MYQNAFYILGGKDFCFKDNSSLNTVFGQKCVRTKALIFIVHITINMAKHESARVVTKSTWH